MSLELLIDLALQIIKWVCWLLSIVDYCFIVILLNSILFIIWRWNLQMYLTWNLKNTYQQYVLKLVKVLIRWNKN
jgi:hypothetical protein